MEDAIYARQSVEKLNSLSIEGQIDLCRRAAGKELRVYQDRGYSGKNTERPAFQSLLRDIQAGKIGKLYVYRLDRFSRSVADFGRLWEILQASHVEFVSVSENFDTTTPMGRAMLHIIMVFAQLEREMDELLSTLPYCVSKDENKELACKVLLGILSQEDARQQASYMQGIKAVSVTQGLAPQLLKNYLGTKSAKELVTFFNKSLEPYTFWKSNREKHLFALHSLVEELNGKYNHPICQFLFEMLENGSSVSVLTDMLPAIEQKKDAPHELDTLLTHYRQARAQAKSL